MSGVRVTLDPAAGGGWRVVLATDDRWLPLERTFVRWEVARNYAIYLAHDLGVPFDAPASAPDWA